MRILVRRDALAHAIKTTAAAVGKVSVPILSGVVLDASEDLALTTFDLDTFAIETVTGAVVTEPGRTVVSHRLLSQVVNVCPPGDISISSSDRGITVKAGRASWELPTMPIEDYPEIPKGGAQAARLDGADFLRAIDRVSVAASDQPGIEPPIDVVYLGFEHDHLAVVATDGRRMHTALVDATTANPETFLLIPAVRVRQLAKLIGDGPITLHTDGNLFEMSTSRATVGMRTADSTKGWSKWETLLQSTETHALATAVVDRGELYAVIKQTDVFAVEADKGHRHLSFTFDRAGDLTVEAGVLGSGTGTATMTTQHDGPGIRLTVNAEFFATAVNACAADSLRLMFTGPKKPIGLAEGDGPIVHVVMPVASQDAVWMDEVRP